MSQFIDFQALDTDLGFREQEEQEEQGEEEEEQQKQESSNFIDDESSFDDQLPYNYRIADGFVNFEVSVYTYCSNATHSYQDSKLDYQERDYQVCG